MGWHDNLASCIMIHDAPTFISWLFFMQSCPCCCFFLLLLLFLPTTTTSKREDHDGVRVGQDLEGWGAATATFKTVTVNLSIIM